MLIPKVPGVRVAYRAIGAATIKAVNHAPVIGKAPTRAHSKMESSYATPPRDSVPAIIIESVSIARVVR